MVLLSILILSLSFTEEPLGPYVVLDNVLFSSAQWNPYPYLLGDVIEEIEVSGVRCAGSFLGRLVFRKLDSGFIYCEVFFQRFLSCSCFPQGRERGQG